MQTRHGEFVALGASVVGVCAAPPALLASFLASAPSPFPLVTDPSRAAYQALGMGRTSWLGFLRPGVLAGYLRLVLAGWLPRSVGAGEDPLQLGGDFVLDSARKVVYARASKDPTDRPSVDELLAAVRGLRGVKESSSQ